MNKKCIAILVCSMLKPTILKAESPIVNNSRPLSNVYRSLEASIPYVLWKGKLLNSNYEFQWEPKQRLLAIKKDGKPMSTKTFEKIRGLPHYTALLGSTRISGLINTEPESDAVVLETSVFQTMAGQEVHLMTYKVSLNRMVSGINPVTGLETAKPCRCFVGGDDVGGCPTSGCQGQRCSNTGSCATE